MLTNAYLLAKIGADTAENERHFAEILPIGRGAAGQNGPRGADGVPGARGAGPGPPLLRLRAGPRRRLS